MECVCIVVWMYKMKNIGIMNMLLVTEPHRLFYLRFAWLTYTNQLGVLDVDVDVDEF